MKVSLVVGTTGEYSSRTEWIVGAFISKAFAEEYCEKVNQWCLENGVSSNTRARGSPVVYDGQPLNNPYDSDFQYSYTGTEYFVTKNVPVMDSLDPIDSETTE